MEGLGLCLQNLREKYNYSRIEISTMLGFSKNVYGSYEREARTPSLETMIKLADIFEVSIDYLIRGEAYQSNHAAGAAPEKNMEYQLENQKLPEDWLQLIDIFKKLNPEARRKLIEFIIEG